MNYTDWTLSELSGLPNTKNAYLYKQEKIAQMTARANELVSKGIKDNNVIDELIKDEFKNIKQDFYALEKTQKNKKAKIKSAQTSALSVIVYSLGLVLFYLIISFLTHLWSKTWLILVIGLLVPLGFISYKSARKTMEEKNVFSFSARVSMASAIMLISIAAFLVFGFIGSFSKSWMILIAGIIAILCADIFFSKKTQQKTSIFTTLLYLPVIASLVFVLGGVTHILPWHPGWMIIVISLFADFVLALKQLKANSKSAQEDEPWEEN